jgi:hypothetical protein
MQGDDWLTPVDSIGGFLHGKDPSGIVITIAVAKVQASGIGISFAVVPHRGLVDRVPYHFV